MNKIWLTALILGGMLVSKAPAVDALPLSADTKSHSISQAVHQLDEVLASLTQQIETQHPQYREALSQFRAHLTTCSSFVFDDPVLNLQQNIQGWEGQQCQVQVTAANSSAPQKEILCLYSKSDLKVERLGLQHPFTHSSCQPSEWASRS